MDPQPSPPRYIRWRETHLSPTYECLLTMEIRIQNYMETLLPQLVNPTWEGLMTVSDDAVNLLAALIAGDLHLYAKSGEDREEDDPDGDKAPFSIGETILMAPDSWLYTQYLDLWLSLIKLQARIFRCFYQIAEPEYTPHILGAVLRNFRELETYEKKTSTNSGISEVVGVGDVAFPCELYVLSRGDEEDHDSWLNVLRKVASDLCSYMERLQEWEEGVIDLFKYMTSTIGIDEGGCTLLRQLGEHLVSLATRINCEGVFKNERESRIERMLERMKKASMGEPVAIYGAKDELEILRSCYGPTGNYAGGTPPSSLLTNIGFTDNTDECVYQIGSRLENYLKTLIPELPDPLSDDTVTFLAHLLACDIHVHSTSGPDKKMHPRCGEYVGGLVLDCIEPKIEQSVSDSAHRVGLPARLFRRLYQVADPLYNSDIQLAMFRQINYPSEEAWPKGKPFEYFRLDNFLKLGVLCDLYLLSVGEGNEHELWLTGVRKAVEHIFTY
ncbi:hypothetical protein BU16DRAFT_541458 [Lophium mytilinum]|uniref:Uncharacterized protein n=1 Tax=Lophium mytilinum TaxID=390894 RepID=A0A6A6QJW1_9PEZI|nr:hypothetical protein BU16DRAFT_541458 [Lophium mytilinum]